MTAPSLNVEHSNCAYISFDILNRSVRLIVHFISFDKRVVNVCTKKIEYFIVLRRCEFQLEHFESFFQTHASIEYMSLQFLHYVMHCVYQCTDLHKHFFAK